MNRKATIETKDLAIGYPKTKTKSELIVLKDLTVSLYSGELTCLLGSNGIGKSTLLRTLTNMQKPLAGNVFLQGKLISDYKARDISSILGVVLTDKTSAGGLTVRELVGLGRYPYTGFWGRLSNADHAIVDKAMSDVGIIYKADSYISDLSDGERQKVMIAKSLAQECPIIILDEPTAFLDVTNRFEIMNLLHQLALEQDKTILLSTHDLELAFLLADRLWLMSENKNLKTGVTEDLILSGTINDYVTNDSVNFDSMTGKFVSNQKGIKKITLEAESELYCWTKNFLERKGFDISANEDSNGAHLKVISAHNFILRDKDKTVELKSFDDLNNYLG